MSTALKKIFTIMGKQAVNAALTVSLPAAFWHYHVSNWKDAEHMLVILCSVVLGREVTAVGIPWAIKLYNWLLKWSQTTDDAEAK